jgi:hypothetical protein
MLDLSAWPAGMRVIVRKERLHPGAQLRFTDPGGHPFTCFATDTKGGQLSDLELRHHRRAMRGPGPVRQGHRVAQPAAARLRTEPDLGARSPRWPASCWPGCRCSPSPARLADLFHLGCQVAAGKAPWPVRVGSRGLFPHDLGEGCKGGKWRALVDGAPDRDAEAATWPQCLLHLAEGALPPSRSLLRLDGLHATRGDASRTYAERLMASTPGPVHTLVLVRSSTGRSSP